MIFWEEKLPKENFLNWLLFSGDDALKPQVERHRQLLHESRLSQGDPSHALEFIP